MTITIRPGALYIYIYICIHIFVAEEEAEKADREHAGGLAAAGRAAIMKESLYVLYLYYMIK